MNQHLDRFRITSPIIFYAAAGLLVGYLLYMIIRRRRGERPDFQGHEPEL